MTALVMCIDDKRAFARPKAILLVANTGCGPIRVIPRRSFTQSARDQDWRTHRLPVLVPTNATVSTV